MSPTTPTPSRKLLGIPILLVAIASCSALPDPSPFTTSTTQLRSAWIATGAATQAELQTAIENDAVSIAPAEAKNLEAALAATTASLDAMVEYASSLQAIVAAGQSGAASVQAVADSVKALTDAASVSPTSGATNALIDLSTKTFQFVYGEIAKHRAAKDLEDALDKFGPSMDQITKLVEAQIADCQRLLDVVAKAQSKQLRAGGVPGYGDWIKTERALQAQLQTQTKALNQALGRAGEAAVKEQQIKAAKQAIAEIEVGLESIAPHTAEYRERMADLNKRTKTGSAAIAAVRSTIASWQQTHRNLVQAVKQRTPFSAAGLAAAIVETKALVRKWQDL